MENKPIQVNGEYITQLEFLAKYFLGKSINVWGVSGSGKSYITNDLLACLAPYLYCLHVFSTTAESDREFPMTGYTNKALIHEKLDIQKVEEVVDAAVTRTKLYNAAMVPNKIYKSMILCKTIYKECKDGKYKLSDEDMKKFDRYNKMNTKGLPYVKRRIKKIKKAKSKDQRLKLEDDIIEVGLVILKKVSALIFNQKGLIDLGTYDKDDIEALATSRINPRIGIVFNDVGDDIKNLSNKGKAAFDKLYTRGRHAKMTIIFLAQSLPHVTKTARSNAKINIFSTPGVMSDVMKEIANSDRKRAEEIGRKVFGADAHLDENNKKHFKLIYFKAESKFYYLQADKMGEQVMVGKKRYLNYLDNILKEDKVNLFRQMF